MWLLPPGLTHHERTDALCGVRALALSPQKCSWRLPQGTGRSLGEAIRTRKEDREPNISAGVTFIPLRFLKGVCGEAKPTLVWDQDLNQVLPSPEFFVFCLFVFKGHL